MSESYDMRQCGNFTVGAIGEPGSRMFYFQALGDDREFSLRCEKQQAMALAEHLTRLLADLPAEDESSTPVEAFPPEDLAWTVGSIALGIDRATSQIVVQFEELLVDEEGQQITDDVAHFRVRLDRNLAAAYIEQAAGLMAASRPVCRLCDQPIDPSGHACPRLN